MNPTHLVSLAALMVIIYAIYRSSKEKYKKYAADPLMPIDESRYCEGPHSWRKAVFLHVNERDAYSKDPETFTKNKSLTYCEHCGYIPSMNKMVKLPFLLNLAKQETAFAAAHQKLKDVEELSAAFFQGCLEESHYKNPRDRQILADGYQLHENFVNYLPELLAAKALRRERDRFDEEVRDAELKKKKA